MFILQSFCGNKYLLTKSGILFDCFFTISANNDAQQLSFYFKHLLQKNLLIEKFLRNQQQNIYFSASF